MLEKIITSLIYIILGIIIYEIIKSIINKTLGFTNKNLKSHQKQRVTTVKSLILNIAKYIICILIILAILA